MSWLERFMEALFNLHPPHTMAVHFPIALTGAALLFILLALWRRSEMLERAAFLNISLAAVGTLAAALTGMWDNITRYDGGAPNAPLKLFLGVSLLVLSTVMAVIRWRRPEIAWRPATRLLYLVGFVGSFLLAAVLGFLGAVIVYGF